MNPSSRILLILYQYEPLIAPRVFRWKAIAEELVRQGHAVDVVCCAYHDLPVFEVIKGVQVYRVKPWFFQTVYRKNIAFRMHTSLSASQNSENQDPLGSYPQNIKDNQSGSSLPVRTRAFKKDIIPAVLSKLLHALWWPDLGMFWIWPAYNKSRQLLKKHNYQRMIAISWPVCAHVVGYLLAKNHKSQQIPFVVDVGDPFSANLLNPPNNLALYRKLNENFEMKLMRIASGISVTSWQMKKLYCHTLGVEERKIKVIPPLLDPNQHQNISKETSPNPKLRLVYLGSLRKFNRPPHHLLHLFKDIHQIEGGENYELHLIGDYSECKDEIEAARDELHGALIVHGIVSHQQALRATYAADVLVNVGNISKYQVPSKLVDFIASGNPIINIQQVTEDSSVEFLRRFPALCNLDFSTQDHAANLCQAIQFLQNLPPKVPQDIIEELLKDHTTQEVTQLYLSSWWQ